MAEEGQLGGAIQGNCQICLTQPSKYRCPYCSLQTCSLICVKAHKASCSGPPHHHYLPLKELTPEVLESDNRLLLESQNCTETSKTFFPYERKRPDILKVKSYCKRWHTWLDVMPSGMKRARINKSKVLKDTIQWTVEWVSLNETPSHPATMKFSELSKFTKATLYIQCPDTETIAVSLARLTERYKLDNSRTPVVLLRQEIDKDPNLLGMNPSVRLWPIHTLDVTWQALLSNRTIIEFPTVYLQ